MSRTQGGVGKPACLQGQRGGGGSDSTRRVSHCPPARTPNRPRAGRATEFHPSMPMALSSHSGKGTRAWANLTGGILSWRMKSVCSDYRRCWNAPGCPRRRSTALSTRTISRARSGWDPGPWGGPPRCPCHLFLANVRIRVPPVGERPAFRDHPRIEIPPEALRAATTRP